MHMTAVAAQLYTLRDHCQTAKDAAASLAKVRAIGYRAVQVSGIGPIPEDEVVRMCAGEGLEICATHEDGKRIVAEPQAVIDRLGRLGCRYTAYPYPHIAMATATAADISALARDLDRAGAALAAAGITLCYHNHAIELRRIAGRTILERIYGETSPANLQGEIDTYWIQAGGGDPTAWCARLRNRLPLLHLKDFAVNPDGAPMFAEIGNGNLDWPRIVAAAEGSGCRWWIVEQDSCPGDPFASLAQSWRFIRDHLAARGAAARA